MKALVRFERGELSGKCCWLQTYEANMEVGGKCMTYGCSVRGDSETRVARKLVAMNYAEGRYQEGARMGKQQMKKISDVRDAETMKVWRRIGGGQVGSLGRMCTLVPFVAKGFGHVRRRLRELIT